MPKALSGERYVDRSADERSRYPSVTLKDNAVQVSVKVGDIPAGAPVEVFRAPLRLCVGNDLQGLKFSMNYRLYGQNLRSPAKGKLRLLFQ